MTTFVALLRAVNVSGQNKIPMADLRLALGRLGLVEVQTYLQSGNMVFGAEGGDPAAPAALIRELIERDYGCDVHVLVLTAAELALVAAANPFLAGGGSAADPSSALSVIDERSLHATFLEGPVAEAACGGLDLPARPGEQAILASGREQPPNARGAGPAGRVIYLHLPYGYGRTKLTNAYFERALKRFATTRNWRTVLALVKMSALSR